VPDSIVAMLVSVFSWALVEHPTIPTRTSGR
jgi:hypothetical protein